MEISQNFVAFSEHMNFTAKSGKHTFLSVKWLFVTQLDNFICWATSTPWKTFWPYCVIAFLETATCADNALPAFVPDDPTSPSRTLYIDKDRFRKVSLKATYSWKNLWFLWSYFPIWFLLKSVHYKKTVAQSSFCSKSLSFSI